MSKAFFIIRYVGISKREAGRGRKSAVINKKKIPDYNLGNDTVCLYIKSHPVVFLYGIYFIS